MERTTSPFPTFKWGKPPTFKYQTWAVEGPSTSGCGCEEGAGIAWED